MDSTLENSPMRVAIAPGTGLGGTEETTTCAGIFFHGTRLERLTAAAFSVNGLVSIVGTLWTVARPGFMTSAGLVAFALWNVLLGAMAALALVAFRRRRRCRARNRS
jgi:hypothetical protein